MSRRVEVVDYRTEWEKEYKEESKKIKQALGKNCVSVEHIGSTAVKGMKAKPVIDIMPVVKKLSAVDAVHEELEALGYVCKGENGIAGRRFFVKGGENPTFHVHIFEERNKNEIGRHLAVREYLRNHPEDAKEYGELKSRLAAEYPEDIDSYCSGKADYLNGLEKKAVQWTEKQMKIGSYGSMGMCMGMCLGVAFGTATSNLALCMSLGLVIGLFVGTFVGRAKAK